MPFLRAAACLAQPTVNLALQGGGAHGAFTWGVLDALLEDGRVAFDGISGTSAGAMNAVALADGWMRGGREGARQALAGFWQEVAQRWQRSQPGLGLRGSDAPWNRMLRQWASSFSPYELNPLGHDPLREVVQACFDFERLRRESPFRLYIAATEVRTGRLQLFREGELDASRLLASACLPTLQHAVEIAGRSYWDGGYAANPAVSPFLYGHRGELRARDVLLVLLCPLEHRTDPHSAEEIQHRALELSFSSNFHNEMRSFVRMRAELARGWLPPWSSARRLRETRFHMIESNDVDNLHRTDTKLHAHAPFLEELRDQGRVHAQAWLARQLGAVGRRSSIDVDALFG